MTENNKRRKSLRQVCRDATLHLLRMSNGQRLLNRYQKYGEYCSEKPQDAFTSIVLRLEEVQSTIKDVATTTGTNHHKDVEKVNADIDLVIKQVLTMAKRRKVALIERTVDE